MLKLFPYFLALFLGLSNVHAKLIDKIVAVIDNNIITLSFLERVELGLQARKNLAPQIYSEEKLSKEKLIRLMVRSHLIKSRLGEMGYVVSDDQVEQQIKSTEDRLGLNRQKLLTFLNSNNITFDEYFELIRESIEYSLFYQRIITPLITITEQEIKNTFYRNNAQNKTFSFKYGLIDYSFNSKEYSESKIREATEFLRKNEGKLSDKFKDVEAQELGDLTEEGVTKELKTLLKITDEGSYTSPLLMGGVYHVFFVKQKDLVESEIYLKSKNLIRDSLFEKQSKEIIEVWHKREENRRFVKYL